MTHVCLKKMTDDYTRFCREQVITYLGNKRQMLPMFEDMLVAQHKPLTFLDGFSGSGVVSRCAKKYASVLHANDWEEYSRVINTCYLSNPSAKDIARIARDIAELNACRDDPPEIEYMYGNYSPRDDVITAHDRVFYTPRNARIIDGTRERIARLARPEFCLAPLLYAASRHTNTCGYFNSFYKKDGVGAYGGRNADDLARICGEIRLDTPVMYDAPCDVYVHKRDTNALVREMSPVDVAYFDPPYNKHPYGTYYFMLNVIAEWRTDVPVPPNLRGQSDDWQRSAYNSTRGARAAFEDLVEHTRAAQVWVSYSNRGIVSPEEMRETLEKFGPVDVREFTHAPYHKLLGQGSKFRQTPEKKPREHFYVLYRKRK